jgi:CBS domain-containing protein
MNKHDRADPAQGPTDRPGAGQGACVCDRMSRPAVIVSADAPITQALRLMTANRCLPVVDDDTRLVGIVNIDDVLGTRRQAAPRTGPVAAVMSAPVVSIGPERPLAEAMRLLVDRHPRGAARREQRVTLGVGAQNSPRFAPAGLLVAHRDVRVMIDGGPGATPPARLDACLVPDLRGELIAAIRQLAYASGLAPYAGPFRNRYCDRGGRPDYRVGPGVLRVPTMGGRGGPDVRGGFGVESAYPPRRRYRRPPRRAGGGAGGEAPPGQATRLCAHRPSDDPGARRRAARPSPATRRFSTARHPGIARAIVSSADRSAWLATTPHRVCLPTYGARRRASAV